MNSHKFLKLHQIKVELSQSSGRVFTFLSFDPCFFPAGFPLNIFGIKKNKKKTLWQHSLVFTRRQGLHQTEPAPAVNVLIMSGSFGRLPVNVNLLSLNRHRGVDANRLHTGVSSNWWCAEGISHLIWSSPNLYEQQ